MTSMRKLIEATDELNINKPLNIPVGEYGQYQGNPMNTDYGKYPVDMTVKGKAPSFKFLKTLNNTPNSLEDLNARLSRKEISKPLSPEKLNKNLKDIKVADAIANNLKDPEEKTLEQIKAELGFSSREENLRDEHDKFKKILNLLKILDSDSCLTNNNTTKSPVVGYGITRENKKWKKVFSGKEEFIKWLEKNNDKFKVYGYIYKKN